MKRILIIEDDPDVREHLELFLREEGYDAATAVDGPAALELATRRTIRPDLVLADYNLPQFDALRALQASKLLNESLGEYVPAYLKLKHQEWDDFARHLTDWERDATLDC